MNYTLVPRTLSALRRLPLAPETAAFQRQLPGTGLPLHVDPSNWVLGCHVGVVVPAPTGVVTVRPPGDAAGEGFREKGVIERGHSSSRSGTGFGRNGGGARRDGGTKKRPSKANRRGDRDNGSGDRQTVTSTNSEVAEDGVGNAAPSRVPTKGSTATTATQEEEKVDRPLGAGVAVARQDGGGDGGGDGGVGERAWMEVAGEKRNWEAGRAFVFDPSFLHRTHNPTSGERVILNVDIWHPELMEVERTAIRRVCELVEQWNAQSGLFEG